MILIVGATGELGGLIASTLLQQGNAVRVLVRDPAARDSFTASGAEAVMADLKDPSSLMAACAGIDAVVTTANSSARGGDDTVESVDAKGNRNLIEAAAAQGVRHFIFVSALGADPEHPVPFMRAKGETEQLLRESGMTWTILQPELYFDKLPMMLVGGPALAGLPVTLVGQGRSRHSLVAARDVAAYAVAVLRRGEANNRTLLIGGPGPVSLRDMVAAFEDELGREVPVRAVPPGESVDGVPDFVLQVVAGLENFNSELDMSELAATFGVTPTTLHEFVHHAAATGSPAAVESTSDRPR